MFVFGGAGAVQCLTISELDTNSHVLLADVGGTETNSFSVASHNIHIIYNKPWERHTGIRQSKGKSRMQI